MFDQAPFDEPVRSGRIRYCLFLVFQGRGNKSHSADWMGHLGQVFYLTVLMLEHDSP